LLRLSPSQPQRFAEADEALGFPLSKIFFDGPEDELRLTGEHPAGDF